MSEGPSDRNRDQLQEAVESAQLITARTNQELEEVVAQLETETDVRQVRDRMMSASDSLTLAIRTLRMACLEYEKKADVVSGSNS